VHQSRTGNGPVESSLYDRPRKRYERHPDPVDASNPVSSLTPASSFGARPMSTKAHRIAPRSKTARTRKPVRPSPEPARAGKRERNKVENRAEILVAAREVFTELGYDAATVRDIIRRTNLASGTFYNYFPDKESVFRTLFRESEERRLAWLRTVERRDGAFDEYWRDTFRAYFEFVVSDRTTFELFRRNAQTLLAFSRDAVKNERLRLTRVLAAAMESDLLPRTNAEFLASAILGVAFEVAVLMVEQEPIDVEGATEFVTDLFLGFFAKVRGARSGKQGRGATG
jgi:AcrR family transcriptional regulator